eukprot:scaffold284674_cov17-Tisochrysis_lutea.AAC.1
MGMVVLLATAKLSAVSSSTKLHVLDHERPCGLQECKKHNLEHLAILHAVLFTARADAGNKPIPIEARAVMEAAVCLSLSHPNIVSCCSRSCCNGGIVCFLLSHPNIVMICNGSYRDGISNAMEM